MQPHAPSWYAATAGPAPARPPASGNLEADVCVVGGGFTGLSTALHCAEAGRSVVLLEAERIGWSASGRNGGQALTGLGCEAMEMVALLGEPGARALWASSLEAVRLQRALIERHAIACDYKPGYVIAAPKPRHLDGLGRELDLIGGRWGYGEARLVDATATASMLGTRRYAGGLFDGGSGHLHPLNYALGLARAAEAAGARLCEGSPVLSFDGGRASVRTASATVRAKAVALACNAHVEGLAPAAARAVLPVEATMIATAPLPAGLGVLPSNVAVSDANRLLDYYRLSGDGRLLFGGRLGPGVGARPPRLRRRMLKIFPQLAGADVEHRWTGWVALTLNRLPHFGRLGPGILFAHGFSGHGVALTTLAGKLLAEAIGGEPDRFERFARIPHARIPFGRRLRPALVGLSAFGAALRDAL